MGKPKKVRISESSIQDAIILILSLDGWDVTVTDPGYRPGQVLPPGYEKGTADLLCIRPLYFAFPSPSQAFIGEVMYIETKAQDGEVSTAQRIWHSAKRARGFRTFILMEDIGASTEEFKKWYEDRSGLCRRKLT